MAILQTTGVSGSLSISSSRIPQSTSASLFSVNGYNGRLLNVVDTLSGSLFSVNTIAGLPVFEVFSNNKVVAGKYNANDFVISGSRVGIGTNSPAYKLDVQSTTATARLGNAIVGSWPSNSPYATFGHNSLDQTNAGNYALLQFSNGTTYLNASSGQNLYFRIANADAMMIDSNRNVGIGTTGPSYLLDIYKTTNDSIARIRTTAAGAYLYLDSATDGYFGTAMFSGGTAKWFLGCYGATTDLQIKRGASDTGTELVRVKTNGNVGIGTNNPLAKLHVSSSATTPSAYFQGKVGIGSSVPETDLSVYDMNLGRVTISVLGVPTTYYGVWLTGGTASTDFNFLSSPSDTNLYINAPASRGIYNQINNTNTLTILGTSISTTVPLGVNTTPTYTLDVTGTGNFTGKVGIGAVPGTGQLLVNAGGTSNLFLTVANALGTTDTTTSGYTARGFIAIDLGTNVITGRTGTHYIQVYSKP